MSVEMWLLGTAIVFTFVGMYMARFDRKEETKNLVEAIIDDLIRQGYIKNFKDSKGETELMKWWEDYPKQVDKSID
jgi:hypothetical protein